MLRRRNIIPAPSGHHQLELLFAGKNKKGKKANKKDRNNSYSNDYEKDVLTDQDVWSWVDLVELCGQDSFVTEITYRRCSLAVSINPIISPEVGPMTARKAFVARISYHPRPSTVS